MASGLQHLPAGILSSPSNAAQMLRATSERWGSGTVQNPFSVGGHVDWKALFFEFILCCTRSSRHVMRG